MNAEQQTAAAAELQQQVQAVKKQWLGDYTQAAREQATLYAIAYDELSTALGVGLSAQLAEPLLEKMVRGCATQADALMEERLRLEQARTEAAAVERMAVSRQEYPRPW